MAFKEINITSPLEMGRAPCWQIRGFKVFQRALTQKSFKYSHRGGVKIDDLTLKTYKGEGNNEAKKKAYGWNIEKGYQKPPKCPLILGACLHFEHLHLKPHVKIKKWRK